MFRNIVTNVWDSTKTAIQRNNQSTHNVEGELVIIILRFLADSNCCKRFCRPVPNHSAKEPFWVLRCKVTTKFSHMQQWNAPFCQKFTKKCF